MVNNEKWRLKIFNFLIIKRSFSPILFLTMSVPYFIYCTAGADLHSSSFMWLLCFCKKMQKSPVPMKGTRENPRGATLFQEPKLSSKAPQSGAV